MEVEKVVTYTLPVISVGGIVPLPHNEIRIDISKEENVLAIKDAMLSKDKLVVLLVQKDINVISPNFNSLNNIGVLGKISFSTEVNNTKKIKINGLIRCEVISYASTVPFLVATVEERPSFSSDIDQEIASARLLVEELEQTNSNWLKGNKDNILQLSKYSIDHLVDELAYHMPIAYDVKMKYLNTFDTVKRIKYLLEDLRREKLLQSIEKDIDDEVRKVINESQREYYLREKMKVIQDELGDKAKKESEIEDLKTKILETKMPKEVEEKALNELSRYSSMGINSSESSVIRNYLDFTISLPWNKSSIDSHDINKAKKQLDTDHYGLEKVKERILEYLAVCIMTKKTPQAILCLVGPPGVGKTSLARSIATALNKKFVKQSLGGMKDESEIRGHRRTYIGALPGRILQGLKKAQVNNPVFLLDEIDKLSSDYKGDPSSALLEVLDSEQNKYFSDNFLEDPFDLSKVFFIATANYLENIPAALKDRLEIVELSSYTEFEKFSIAKEHLIDKQLALHGLSKCDFNLTDDALWMIIREYTKEAGVRELERIIGTLIRKSIKKILSEGSQVVNITDQNLPAWIGKSRFGYNKVDEKDQIGVVTGLAYTQYGGDTLPVEVTYYQGNGHLVLTGKLGDVMKESGQAALSYVKSNAQRFGIDVNIFKENDIHVHVPEGAIPKDGPSAGVALATAIVSALTNKYVNHLVGMTGEITLRGRVLPIGGLREKSIAAHRSGLKTIIIPKENVKDLEEIPVSVLEELNIIPVTTIDEVLQNSLL